MLEQTKRDINALCEAGKKMQEASNLLYWAYNPEENTGTPVVVSEAEEQHSNAFETLTKAIHYAQKSMLKETESKSTPTNV